MAKQKLSRIVTAHGEINEIARIFNKSLPTIRKALRGDTTVEGYEKIRKCALERGAIEMQKVTIQKHS